MSTHSIGDLAVLLGPRRKVRSPLYPAAPRVNGMAEPVPFIACQQNVQFEDKVRSKEAEKKIRVMHDFIRNQATNKEADYSVSALIIYQFFIMVFHPQH